MDVRRVGRVGDDVLGAVRRQRRQPGRRVEAVSGEDRPGGATLEHVRGKGAHYSAAFSRASTTFPPSSAPS